MANEIIYELQPQTSWQPIVLSGVYHRAYYRRNAMTEERRHNDEAIIAELRGLRALFDNKIDTLTATTGRIEVQTTKTNGRVLKLEQEVEILKIINAEEEGGKKALKPYQTVILSVFGSLLTAIGINWAIK